MTWNVQGLNTCLQDNEFLNFVSQFDILFCCETWQRQNDKFTIEGYNCICVPRPESLKIRGKGRRGHGGICLFVRESLSKGIEVIETDPAGFIWVKFCKDFFSLTFDLYNCFCYIPPKESIYFKNVDIDLYDVLENGIRKYSDLGKIAVYGDLNARTGVLDDRVISGHGLDKYIHCLEGAEFAEDSVGNIGRRFSLDMKTDSSGLRLIQLCK
ncbi:MAG: endonuclease/exonuclease/phosphatase family protein, partial [Candidatus Thiodiazotropha sp.]